MAAGRSSGTRRQPSASGLPGAACSRGAGGKGWVGWGGVRGLVCGQRCQASVCLQTCSCLAAASPSCLLPANNQIAREPSTYNTARPDQHTAQHGKSDQLLLEPSPAQPSPAQPSPAQPSPAQQAPRLCSPSASSAPPCPGPQAPPGGGTAGAARTPRAPGCLSGGPARARRTLGRAALGTCAAVASCCVVCPRCACPSPRQPVWCTVLAE
jgi:hypothetical protein